MKRLWIGIGFLIFLLAAGIVISVLFSSLHSPIAQSLQKASEAALSGDWSTASTLTKQAHSSWNALLQFTAAVADHEPLEEMDAAFSVLETYMALGWWGEFAALSAQLAQMAGAMAESQAFLWWNLL